MSVTSGKGLTLGDGLDSLALAIFILGMVYMIGKGVAFCLLLSDYITTGEARCQSLNGYYGGNKCFINGEEV